MFKLLKEKFNKLKEKIAGEEKKALRKKKVEKKVGIKEKVKKKILYKKLSEDEISKVLEEFEIDLIEADCSPTVTSKIVEEIKKRLIGKEARRGDEENLIKNTIKEVLEEILDLPRIKIDELIKKKSEGPFLIIFFGFNGSGKTTSMAKLAKYLLDRNITVVFAAGDTFRAASIEQLEEHSRKLGIKVIKHKYGADPAAVIFDAVKYAKSKGIKVVLADTAGRTHMDKNLIEELRKIVRVNNPDLKVLVLDSLTGIDVLSQFEMFNEAVGVDAIVFTKLDVNEKGGNILSIAYEFKKPILFFGTGQDYDDIKWFEKDWLIKQIVSE